eukprot:307787-Hanusia_phi.AAC.1
MLDDLESKKGKASFIRSRYPRFHCHTMHVEEYLFKLELGVPLKDCPYRLGPARGCVYLEGPLHITLPLKQTSTGIVFTFSKIIRMGCTNKLIWDFPPSK